MNKLATLRTQNGLTQEGLARAADISLCVVASAEQGRRSLAKMQLRTAAALARVLGVHAEDLLEEDGPMGHVSGPHQPAPRMARMTRDYYKARGENLLKARAAYGAYDLWITNPQKGGTHA